MFSRLDELGGCQGLDTCSWSFLFQEAGMAYCQISIISERSCCSP
jgi:hypothetical protein